MAGLKDDGGAVEKILFGKNLWLEKPMGLLNLIDVYCFFTVWLYILYIFVKDWLQK